MCLSCRRVKRKNGRHGRDRLNRCRLAVPDPMTSMPDTPAEGYRKGRTTKQQPYGVSTSSVVLTMRPLPLVVLTPPIEGVA